MSKAKCLPLRRRRHAGLAGPTPRVGGGAGVVKRPTGTRWATGPAQDGKLVALVSIPHDPGRCPGQGLMG